MDVLSNFTNNLVLRVQILMNLQIPGIKSTAKRSATLGPLCFSVELLPGVCMNDEELREKRFEIKIILHNIL
jgi:hypothetical protein